jgi:polar amino acid transport system ATP-binding protein
VDEGTTQAATDAIVPAIEARSLYKRLGQTDVLRGVSLEVAPGEVVAVIGRSGSGKSTLLRCLIGLERPDAGEVLVGGKLLLGRQKVTDRLRFGPDYRRTRLQIGLVFQHFTLFPQLTILQNVLLGPTIVLKVPRETARREAVEVLARVGLSDKLNAYPDFLSGGQKQRAAIARELAMHRKALLFDEVTSALDPELVREVLQVMRDLATDGTTMVIVTHEMDFARNAADRVLFMDGGVIVEQGSPDQVILHPEEDRTREFVGSYRSLRE